MKVRRRCLPPGWYPGAAEQTRQAIEELAGGLPLDAAAGVAGVAPHAGWEFSGSIALEVLSHIARGMDTLVIIGGHLGPADGILCAFEDAYETPLGVLQADLELLRALTPEITIREDRQQDNTVEIQLPLVRYLAPDIRVLGMRAPPGGPRKHWERRLPKRRTRWAAESACSDPLISPITAQTTGLRRQDPERLRCGGCGRSTTRGWSTASWRSMSMRPSSAPSAKGPPAHSGERLPPSASRGHEGSAGARSSATPRATTFIRQNHLWGTQECSMPEREWSLQRSIA